MTNRTDQRSEAVVEFLTQRPMEAFFSNEIAEAVGVRHASIYPALAALERQGKIQSDWQEMAEPRRRVYWATRPSP